MKDYWDKGLCYYCDDRLLPSNKCKAPILYLLSRLSLPSEDTSEEVYYNSSDATGHIL
jgi:hypothetical protein